ncbi:MAG: cupin domain-containing protein [bacterium]
MKTGNLFTGTPAARQKEVVESLIEAAGFTLERIVSQGQPTPPGKWYDQERDEWVVLLSGAARLRIDGEAGERSLRPGDWLLIPARKRHRVEWTAPDGQTVWLALHYG